MAKVIGISGKAGHGKDTAASFLQYKVPRAYLEDGTGFAEYQKKLEAGSFNERGQIIKFAQPLRDFICSITGVDNSDIEKNDFKNTPIDWLSNDEVKVTPRDIMIAVGDALRGLNEDFFLLVVKEKIDKLRNNQTAIITDVRYNNEAKFLKGIGGSLLRVNRKNTLPSSYHQSEIDLDDYDGFDYVIENDEGLAQLALNMERISIMEKL